MRRLLVAAMLAATAVPALAQEKCANCGRVESIREYTAKTELDAARRCRRAPA